jgi:pseudoazurin
VNNISKLLGAAALFAALSHVGAMAADYKVLMKGTGSQPMRFEPDFLKIAAGDTVTFVPEDAGHNVTSIDGLAPEGTEWWGGKRDQQLTATFGAEGLHAYKCPPHYYMGMVGLIQVGDAVTDFDPVEVAKLPGEAPSRMKALLAKAGVAVAD